jgi:hypothetical protein
MFKGGNFRGPDTIVDYIDVVMIGLADAYRDGGVVEGIISSAIQKAESAEVKAGQQQRPEL